MGRTRRMEGREGIQVSEHADLMYSGHLVNMEGFHCMQKVICMQKRSCMCVGLMVEE